MESQPQNPEFRNNPDSIHPGLKEQCNLFLWSRRANILNEL